MTATSLTLGPKERREEKERERKTRKTTYILNLRQPCKLSNEIHSRLKRREIIFPTQNRTLIPVFGVQDPHFEQVFDDPLARIEGDDVVTKF
jgi:hypothetical protein